MSETYNVVLLIEQALTDADAGQVRSLHEGLDDTDVRYHVLLPVEDAAARVEAAMGAVGGDTMMRPRCRSTREPSRRSARRASASRPGPWRRRSPPSRAAGATADGNVVYDDPIDALSRTVPRSTGVRRSS